MNRISSSELTSAIDIIHASRGLVTSGWPYNCLKARIQMNGWLYIVRSHILLPRTRKIIYVLIAVDFFNHLNMLYGTVTEFCTPQEVRVKLPEN